MENIKFHFKLLTRSWKTKISLQVTNSRKSKFWFQSCSWLLYWNEILYKSELFGKIVDMLDFAILDVDLALSGYRL